MTKDAFNDRRKALEDEFFHRVDEKLLVDMKAKTVTDAVRKQLEEVTGATDQKLIDELIDTGATAESVAAMSLVPLILVAWADGKMDPEEREPILKAAADQGIAIDSPAAKLLELWLAKKPDRKLAETWKLYITDVSKKVSTEAKTAMRDDISRRAYAVANAAGGVLGFGKVSSDEKRVIAELEQAFES